MKRNIAVIMSLLTLALSGCGLQGDNGDAYSDALESYGVEPTSEMASENETLASEISDEISENTSPRLETPTAEQPKLFKSIESDKGELIFEIFPTAENFKLWSEEFSAIPFHYVLNVTHEFRNLVFTTEDEFDDWSATNNSAYIDLENFERNTALDTELKALYRFICDFDLSEQQVRETLAEANKFGWDEGEISKYIYSEEEITALATRNKTEIVRLFANPSALVKGDKFYAPAWFFFASVEEYKNNNMTCNDIMFIIIDFFNNAYTGENCFTNYFRDLVEYKAYNYLNGDIDVVELCGYDRDFDMPMAYDVYYESVLQREDGYERYACFYYPCGEYNYDITKDENSYSPHWVYHNKPEAYHEAGITPDELIAMLPLYKSLGIMSDEAVTALEGKLEAYAGEYDET